MSANDDEYDDDNNDCLVTLKILTKPTQVNGNCNILHSNGKQTYILTKRLLQWQPGYTRRIIKFIILHTIAEFKEYMSVYVFISLLNTYIFSFIKINVNDIQDFFLLIFHVFYLVY